MAEHVFQSILQALPSQIEPYANWLKNAFPSSVFTTISSDALSILLIELALQPSYREFRIPLSDGALVALVQSSFLLNTHAPAPLQHAFHSQIPLPQCEQQMHLSLFLFGTTLSSEERRANEEEDALTISLKHDHLQLGRPLPFSNDWIALLLQLAVRNRVACTEIRHTISQNHHSSLDLYCSTSTLEQCFLRALSLLSIAHASRTLSSALMRTAHIPLETLPLFEAIATWIHVVLSPTTKGAFSKDVIEEVLSSDPSFLHAVWLDFQGKFSPSSAKTPVQQRSPPKDLDTIRTGVMARDQLVNLIFSQALAFIGSVLKTNFFAPHGALSFRLKGTFFQTLSPELKSCFADAPYALFFVHSSDCFGFHIRFTDLARGGLRTVFPSTKERAIFEAPLLLIECYQLALTQQKKNKDIPEGGAKAILWVNPLHDALQNAERVQQLYRSQRLFVKNLLQLVNYDASGCLKDPHIIDLWARPENLYLGPDENMHDAMIEWIAHYSTSVGYAAGRALISSKPRDGINHKTYGVTSLGVNVYAEAGLQFIGIDPHKDCFTVKMSGGPDGDVAGNELLNLFRFYPETAKVIALTDGTGTVYEKRGLDLRTLKQLFLEGKGIAHYPTDQLSEGSFLLRRERQELKYWLHQKMNGALIREPITDHAAEDLFQNHVHTTSADLFIPAGGRPNTLNETNVASFFDREGTPTARIIVEGANLYLTPRARNALEEKGVLIFKDSSANKGGVICSSFEVLCSLTLSQQQFLEHKETLVRQILEKIEFYAQQEARFLLETHRTTRLPLTKISDTLSAKINLFTAEILESLSDPANAEDACGEHLLLHHALPLLRERFSSAFLEKLPLSHKRAIIASNVGSSLVYRKGLDWGPTIKDLLPLLLRDGI